MKREKSLLLQGLHRATEAEERSLKHIQKKSWWGDMDRGRGSVSKGTRRRDSVCVKGDGWGRSGWR